MADEKPGEALCPDCRRGRADHDDDGDCMPTAKPGEDEALRIAREWVPKVREQKASIFDVAQAIREYGEREREAGRVEQDKIGDATLQSVVAALQERIRQTEALATRRGVEREAAEEKLRASEEKYARTMSVTSLTRRVKEAEAALEKANKELEAERGKVALARTEGQAEMSAALERGLAGDDGLWPDWIYEHRRRVEDLQAKLAAEREEHEKTKAERGKVRDLDHCAKHLTDMHMETLRADAATDRVKDLEGALREAAEALDHLWAAIGDRLLARRPLSKEYANDTSHRIQEAKERAESLLSKAGRSE